MATNNLIYPHLSQNFIRGGWPGQLNSAWKDREEDPDKVRDYIRAIRNGDAGTPAQSDMTPGQREKMEELRRIAECREE